MNNFVSNINELLVFYEAEISQLKKISVNTKLGETDKELIIKYSIPIFYSHWEGFFVKALIEYINFINSLSLKVDEVNDTILAHGLDDEFNFSVSRTDFNKLNNHVLKIKLFFQQPLFHLNTRVETKSNLNFSIANGILNRLCLHNLPIEREKELNRLLLFRNNIAHGECSVPTKYDIIFEMSNITINCIYDLYLLIEEGINNRRFLKR